MHHHTSNNRLTPIVRSLTWLALAEVTNNLVVVSNNRLTPIVRSLTWLALAEVTNNLVVVSKL